MSGFDNAFRLLKRPEYLDVVVTGAHSLATRYSPIVLCTRSRNSAQGFRVNFLIKPLVQQTMF
jgi:hypothetical protein